jgi:hypothetical protein
MSLDLEVRSDDEYTKAAQREVVVACLRDEVRARDSAQDFFVYDRDGNLVEITIGHDESQAGAAEVVSWIGFRVPAGASFKSGDAAYRLSVAVAQRLGWRVYDPQRDDYVPPSELEPGPSFRQALATLLNEARQEGAQRLLVRTAHRVRHQSITSIGYIAAAGFIIAAVGGRIFGYRFEHHPRAIVLIASALAAALFLGDVILDVLGAVHQDALRREEGRAAEQGVEADEAR